MEDRLDQTAKVLKSGYTADEQWQQRRSEIIRALADNNMSVTKAARSLYMHPNTVKYHIRRMQKDGENPMDFHQLAEMLGYTRQEDANAEET